ncbi:hypothetical protein APR40_10515 [Salegentibacter salarius]|uniref:Uncharacterized protein n=1 Tax=Salegentibacter salarius TaxID=435906 RepID=A0A2N0TXX7_9FLAO|nr:hypothetical protein BHS39_10535 [Salegentibacter salarius]PKD19508.1 hypothetical protein APR40_10515 [Salegentibacter salarius]SLJ98898.1 hypothetical protein SAMN05660445_02159 [Salegentibacter salarius]
MFRSENQFDFENINPWEIQFLITNFNKTNGKYKEFYMFYPNLILNTGFLYVFWLKNYKFFKILFSVEKLAIFG